MPEKAESDGPNDEDDAEVLPDDKDKDPNQEKTKKKKKKSKRRNKNVPKLDL